MNDREMLELAALAAGYNVRWHDRWHCYVHVGKHNIDKPPTMAGQRQVWIPLDDDGDAFRLAVKLGIRISDYSSYVFIDTDLLDVYAATRLIITRAAAEIGRNIKER